MASTDNTFEIDKLADAQSATSDTSQSFSGIDFSDQAANAVLTITPSTSGSSSFGIGSGITTTIDTDIGPYRSCYFPTDEKEAKLQADSHRLKLVEMHQVDGTKLLKLIRFSDLLNVREVKVEDPTGQLVTAVQFEDKDAPNATFTIACDLAAFARLFGLEYERFSIAVMESAIEGD